MKTRFAHPMPFLALIAAALLAFGCSAGEPSGDPPGDQDRPPPPKTAHVSYLTADEDREESDASKADLEQLVSDHSSFALWMYHRGIEATGVEENMLFSPLSISTAFSLLWPGAVGETAEEIAQMLHFHMEPDSFHPAGNLLDRELASRNDYEPGDDEGDAPILEIVNDLWGLDDYPYVDEFLELLARHYGAGMWIVDFRNAAEAARQEINEYIAYKTRDLIEELLPPTSIDSLTRLVLTNAIYFKGAWLDPFEEEATRDEAFTALDGTTTDVPMMRGRVDRASYADLDGAEAVELPYVGRDLSMVLILPDEGTFAEFEAGLDAGALSNVFDELSPMEGVLVMPRFEFDSELDLRDIFEDAGFNVLFTPSEADFSGLSEIALEEELHVTGAFHKAAIAVDEEGTEAAAATAIVVGRESAPAEVFNVTLDRPFLFVIRDRPTDTLLFIGRMVDAGAAQG